MSSKPNPATLREALLSKVRRVGECWQWTASTTAGYGQITYRQKRYLAHRAAAVELGGMSIGPGQMVCHHCDNRACINPQHLYVGDAKTNRRDALQRKRWSHPRAKARACSRGHEYKPGSYRTDKDGSRSCRVCHREWKQEYRRTRT